MRGAVSGFVVGSGQYLHISAGASASGTVVSNGGVVTVAADETQDGFQSATASATRVKAVAS